MEDNIEYGKLLKLAKDVAPNSWNIYKHLDSTSCRRERGTLNIGLHIYDGCMARIAREKYNAGGHIENITYNNGVGYVTINIYGYSPIRTQNLLHELAHIAVHRRADLKTKSYKRDHSISNARIIEPCSHGKVFYKCFDIIESRAIKKGWNFFQINKNKIWFFGDTPTIIGIPNIAAFLELSKARVQRLIDSGELPFRKDALGRIILHSDGSFEGEEK